VFRLGCATLQDGVTRVTWFKKSVSERNQLGAVTSLQVFNFFKKLCDGVRYQFFWTASTLIPSSGKRYFLVPRIRSGPLSWPARSSRPLNVSCGGTWEYWVPAKLQTNEKLLQRNKKFIDRVRETEKLPERKQHFFQPQNPYVMFYGTTFLRRVLWMLHPLQNAFMLCTFKTISWKLDLLIPPTCHFGTSSFHFNKTIQIFRTS